MNRIPLGWICLGFGMILAVAAGCARPLPAPSVDPATVPAREWMHQRSGVHRIEVGPVFFGIGRAEGSRNLSLLRAAADNQARTEMARVLGAYVAALAEAAGLEDPEEADRESIHLLTRNALGQARIVDHWFDPAGGTFKTLCRLDLEQFKQALQSENLLDAPLRQRMSSLADQVHQQLAGRLF